MNMILLNIADLNADNLMIALVGYLIVFAALVLLTLVFANIPKILEWQARLRLKQKGKLEGAGEKKEILLPGGVNAAISTALFLYFNEMHDEEQTVITIKKVSKTYSPWSSKIYNMRWPLR
jgi:glutaconyl-CoA/methylmalonyl-CoA decarboxylase subunit delta